MSELVEKIRNAIHAHEAAIDAYEAHRATEGQCVNALGDNPARYDDYGTCAIHIKTAEATPYRDMDFGRRQIAAHRKLLDVHVIKNRIETFGKARLEYSCRRCDWTPEESLWDYGPACEAVMALAEGYDLVDPPG